jgi:hypothetical protein
MTKLTTLKKRWLQDSKLKAAYDEHAFGKYTEIRFKSAGSWRNL